MFGIKTSELLVILVIVLLIFGANRLPQIGAGLGKSIRDIKKALEGRDERDGKEAPPASRSPDEPPPKKP
jgi:sec-independent protein translocase protein TatA